MKLKVKEVKEVSDVRNKLMKNIFPQAFGAGSSKFFSGSSLGTGSAFQNDVDYNLMKYIQNRINSIKFHNKLF
jgi:hypothetical protein